MRKVRKIGPKEGRLININYERMVKMVKRGIIGTLFGLILVVVAFGFVGSILLDSGFSWSCHCTNPRANGGCGSGCSFSGVTCGPGEIQWCGSGGPCKPLVNTPCYSQCKDLLKTGGLCHCGNYVWPTTTIPGTTTTVCDPCTTTTICDPCSTTTTKPYCDGADLMNDPDNCGWCEHECPEGYWCSKGFCVGDIPKPTTTIFCNGADLRTDELNCGWCGNKCPKDYMCVDGFCVGDIPPPNTAPYCDGADLRTDELNCGWCGNKCPPDYYCSNGFCMQDFVSDKCAPRTIVSENFTVGVPGAWQFNQSGGRVEFSESGTYLLMASNGVDNEFPLVGRSDAFSGISQKEGYYFEVRFQYPQIRERASGIYLGTYSPFSAYTKMPDGVGSFDRENVLFIKADSVSGIMNITAFGGPVYYQPYDTDWHVVRLESVSNYYKVYIDGKIYSAGTATTRPVMLWFGNYTYYNTLADWSTLRIDYVKTGTLCESPCSGDYMSDSFNCGWCGNICPTGYSCSRGFCVEPLKTTTTVKPTDSTCLTPTQWGQRESCCDGTDNNQNNLIDARDPSCNVDKMYGWGINEACYGTEHPYRTAIRTESGYFRCPDGTQKMRLYVKAVTESSDKLSIFDGNRGNQMVGVLESNFNRGQYGWTEYYPTSRVKLVFNSDGIAPNWGFDVAKVECYNGYNYSIPPCDSYLCSLKSGNYCNGPVTEYRNYFCSEGVCKHSVSSSAQKSGSCGVYGMTVETDKDSYRDGEEVRVRGKVSNIACPTKYAADVYVEVSTRFGKWNTYTDFAGNYYVSMFNVPAGDHEVLVRAFSEPTGPIFAYGGKWFSKSSEGLKVTIQAVPMTVLAGEKIRITGKVTEQTVPVRQAAVDLRMPWGKEILYTNTFGEYSTDIWTTSWYGNSNVTAYANTGDKAGSASTMITVNPAGNGSEIFTLDAPAIVKPNTLFSAGGKWFIDGVPASEPFILTFGDSRKTARPSEGYYNVTLLSPPTETCTFVIARNLSKQVCTRKHDSMTLSIGYEEATDRLYFEGKYEDGEPVNGTLAYSVGSERYRYERMASGLYETTRDFPAGRSVVYANLNDGRLYASTTKEIVVFGEPGTTVPTTEYPDDEPTPSTIIPTTIQVDSSSLVKATAPLEVIVYRFEEETFAVTIENKDSVERQALVVFGSESAVVRMGPGASAQASFSVPGEGASEKVVPVRVESLGKTVFAKNVKVYVKDFGIIWPRVVFYKGSVSIPYLLTGRTSGAVVNDSLENENGTILVSSSAVSDLPSNGTVSAVLEKGEYTVCANATNTRGNLIIDDCAQVTVKEGMGLSVWFIVAIGVAAVALFFF